MAVYFTTADPKALLAAIKEGIENKQISAWSEDKDGDFTHTATQWEFKGWLRPSIEEGKLALYLMGNTGFKMSRTIYAIYHTRFVESVTMYFDKMFSVAQITAMPNGRDAINPTKSTN